MIGSHLVAELIKAGYIDVILPVRNTAKIDRIKRTFGFYGLEFDPAMFSIVETELTDTAALTRIFRGVDTVFHCAATIMPGKTGAQEMIDGNIRIAGSVADAVISAAVPKVIHTSSVIVLCPPGHGHTVTEENIPQASENAGPYEKGKYGADLEMERVRGAGTDLITVYPSVVLGEGDWSLNGSSALAPVVSRGIPFYADGVMGYVDVRDVARAYITLDNCPEAGNGRFILSAENLSYREIINYGAQAAGKRKPFIRVGKGLFYTAYYTLRTLTSLGLMKNMGMTKGTLGSVLYGNRYIGDKIKKKCSFEYLPVKDTVARVVRNYLKEKKEG